MNTPSPEAVEAAKEIDQPPIGIELGGEAFVPWASGIIDTAIATVTAERDEARRWLRAKCERIGGCLLAIGMDSCGCVNGGTDFAPEQTTAKLRAERDTLAAKLAETEKERDEAVRLNGTPMGGLADECTRLRAKLKLATEALEPFANFHDGDLSNVGGGTLVSPEFRMQVFKDAQTALAAITAP